MLAKSRNFCMVPVLTDDSERIQPPENPSLPQPGQDRSLVDARDDFRSVLSADGALDGDEDRLDHLREQFRSIEKEAARSGYLFEELIHLKIGGVEHDVVFDYEDSYAFVRDDAVVFDTRPANVFATADGVMVPIDCIPVRLPPGKRDFFDK